MNYIILGQGFISKELKKLKDNKNFVFLESEELYKYSVVITQKDKVYINSEASLQSVLEKMNDKKSKDVIIKLKDKFACREILKPLYPSFFFQEVLLKDLSEVRLEKSKK